VTTTERLSLESWHCEISIGDKGRTWGRNIACSAANYSPNKNSCRKCFQTCMIDYERKLIANLCDTSKVSVAITEKRNVSFLNNVSDKILQAEIDIRFTLTWRQSSTSLCMNQLAFRRDYMYTNQMITCERITPGKNKPDDNLWKNNAWEKQKKKTARLRSVKKIRVRLRPPNCRGTGENICMWTGKE